MKNNSLKNNPLITPFITINHADIHLFSCYANNIERNDDMSFVGILQCTDGLLAFGDSRGSLMLSDNMVTEQKGRIIKKVFNADDYILVAYNCNSSPDYRHAFLEEWLDEHIPIANDYFELFNEMILSMQKNNVYNFYIGAKDAHGFFRQIVTVTKENASFGRKIYDASAILRCPSEYFDTWLDDLVKPVILDMTCDEMKRLLEDELTHRIHEADRRMHYSPVGQPLQFVILR